MHVTLYLTYTFSILILIATPGPVLANTIDTSLRKGTRAGFFSIIGSNLASLLLIGFAILFLTSIITLNEAFVYWMSKIGGLYIGYLAISSLLECHKSENKSLFSFSVNPESIKQLNDQKSLKRGFLVSIANPKDILFFISFFPQFIHITDSLYQSLSILTVTWVLLDIGILSLYVVSMQKEAIQRHQKKISTLSNIFLLMISGYGLFLF